MKYKPCKPKIMLSPDNLKISNSKMHFHIIVGKTKDGKNVSVSVTNSPKISGLSVVNLPDNIRKTYVVKRAYVRDPKKYLPVRCPNDYQISSRNEIVINNIAKKTKVPLQ